MKKKCKISENLWIIIKRREQKMYDVENYELEFFEIHDTDYAIAS